MAHRQNRRRNSYKGKDTTPLTQDPQDVMSTAMRLQWNIRVLQRHDPTITTIIDQFNYVVLYRWGDDKWVKRGVEGAMFVYRRTETPQNGFCILNREGAGNFVQPLRKGDEFEITDQYIMYRAVDVGRENYEDFLGIWMADASERARLAEFMLKFQEHLTKTDEPYSPILLHQPLAKPEDAALPLINHLHGNKKGKRGAKNLNNSANTSGSQPQSTPPSVNVSISSDTSGVLEEPAAGASVDSLFAKFMAPEAAPQRAESPPTAALRGQSLLQSMFAAAAADGPNGGVITMSSTATTTHPAAQPHKPHPPTETKVETTSVAILPPSDAQNAPTANDGVEQGNMIKQLLGIPVGLGMSASTSAPAVLGSDGRNATTPQPRPPSAVAPGFVPINEDEEQTPPREVRSRTGTPAGYSTPTPDPRVKQHGPNRELVAYDFEDDSGIVSPWMNEPLQRPKQEKIMPPSPSQLPQPKAVREKRARNKVDRRANSPAVHPRQTYVPQPSQNGQNGRGIEQGAASIALLDAFKHSEAHRPGALPSKEQFVQDLLGLVHSKPGFVDDVYNKYLSIISKSASGGNSRNVVYLD